MAIIFTGFTSINLFNIFFLRSISIASECIQICKFVCMYQFFNFIINLQFIYFIKKFSNLYITYII